MSAEDIQAASEIQLHNALHLTAITFLYWDHLLTLDAEITYCWKQKTSLSSLLFFVNRYFAFFSNISVTILANLNLKTQSCRQYNLYRQLILLIAQVFVCFLMGLRIFALYGRDRRVAFSLYALAFLLGGIAISSFFGQKSSSAPPELGCHIALTQATSARLAIAWETLLIYDTVIFLLTFYKTYKARHNHPLGSIQIPLISLILRDGAIYFAVMALANLTNILTFYFAGPYMRGGLSTFASSISVTMLSRLMLNLHRSASLGILSTVSDSRDTTTGMFSEGETVIELDTLWTSEMGVESPTTPNTPRSWGVTRRRDVEATEVVIPRLPPPPLSPSSKPQLSHSIPPAIIIHSASDSPLCVPNTANTNTSVTFVDSSATPRTLVDWSPLTTPPAEFCDDMLSRRHSYS